MNTCKNCRHLIIDSYPDIPVADTYCAKHFWIVYHTGDTFYKTCKEVRGKKKHCNEWEQGGIKGVFQRLFKKLNLN